MSNEHLIERFSADGVRRGLRPRSVTKRRDVMRNLDRFHHAPLLDLEEADLHAWIDAVPRVDRTIHAYLSCVYGFYCWANVAELTDRNPAAKIPKPKVRPGLPRPIRPDDLALAVAEAPTDIRCWLLLAAFGGLRCQEIAGLLREDVWDFETPVLLHVVHGKGGLQRVVPLHHATLSALRVHGLPRTGPLFRRRSGRPHDAESISHYGGRYLHSLGIDASMHQLRHRFGTDFYRASRDIRLTQDVLGHASPATTAIYTATSPLDAVAVIDGLTIG